jgi:hypothetical protein
MQKRSQTPGRFPTAANLKVDDLIDRYEQIIPDVDEELKEKCISDILPKPSKPPGINDLVDWAENNDPICPEDLTEIPSPQIGKLFSFFSGWANYVTSELTRGKCIQMICTRNAKVVESALKVYYREETETPANLVSEKVDTDERYVKVDSAALKSKVFVSKAEGRLEQLKRSLNLISREQTRRAEELDRTMREGSDRKPKVRLGGGKRTRLSGR